MLDFFAILWQIVRIMFLGLMIVAALGIMMYGATLIVEGIRDAIRDVQLWWATRRRTSPDDEFGHMVSYAKADVEATLSMFNARKPQFDTIFDQTVFDREYDPRLDRDQETLKRATEYRNDFLPSA